MKYRPSDDSESREGCAYILFRLLQILGVSPDEVYRRRRRLAVGEEANNRLKLAIWTNPATGGHPYLSGPAPVHGNDVASAAAEERPKCPVANQAPQQPATCTEEHHRICPFTRPMGRQFRSLFRYYIDAKKSALFTIHTSFNRECMLWRM